MTSHVVVPTAEGEPVRPPEFNLFPRWTGAVLVAVVLVAAGWPVFPFAQAPAAAGEPTSVSAPQLDPPPAQAGRWSSPVGLPAPDSRLAGFGAAVVAITPASLWPAALLRDDGWAKLHGLPTGLTIGAQIGVDHPAGFSLVGVASDRTVLFDFDDAGRFAGARTVPGVVAGPLAAVGDAVAAFDASRPTGRYVTTTITELPPPGRVIGAGSQREWLLVLVDDGTVHGMADPPDGEWELLGDGFVALRSSAGMVVAVGRDATVGLHRFDGALTRLDRAPVGPTVVWGSTVAVHDWSNDSIWTAAGDGRWERLPLWSRDGFHATFEEMVPGAAVPTVVATDFRGERGVWQAGG